ncbi:MAG: NRDE family protein [Burkholderiales bacterium]
MCLAVLALDAHPRHALVLAANRDEYHARPSAPAAWGIDGPFRDVLAGRDLMAGGTWLGLDRRGRFALVTNVREGKAQDPAARSRGELPLLALSATGAVEDAMRAIDVARYNGFNLLAGDARGFSWLSNRGGTLRTVDAGLHGLSNALLDTPWPKVVRTRERLADWLRGDAVDFEPLFAALRDGAQPPDESLPATGVPLQWERLLSSPFIASERYGTRCSTVLTIGRDGRARFVERTFGPEGATAGEVAYEFDVTA